MTLGVTEKPFHILGLADEILSLLEESAARSSTELRSPSLADSVVWSIIISFFVSVASNLFTKGLPTPNRGHLSDKDLEELEKAFKQVAEQHLEFKREQVAQAVQEQLPDYLSALERRRLTSEITDAILKKCQVAKKA